MPRNDEGEFELVIGNRQLLSGFFIVIVLFGVLFAMGYIVGRNSAPTSPSAANSSVRETAPVAKPSSDGPAAGHAEVVMADENKTPSSSVDNPPSATRPATAPPEAPRPAETRPPELPTSESTVPNPKPGRYLQVSAPKRVAANGVVDSLNKKGIPVVLAPGPDAETVRVLVGPLDPADLGKMKSVLEAAGFPQTFPKTY